MRETLCILVALAATAAVCAAAEVSLKLEPIKTVTVGKNLEFRVNGKPFLPIMVWLQGEKRIPQIKSAAMNTICAQSTKLSAKEYLDTLGRSDLYAVMTLGTDVGVARHSHLLGWIQGDEPDMPRKQEDGTFGPRSPESAVAGPYKTIKQAAPSRPVMMNFTAYFMKSKTGKFDAAAKKRVYPAYVRHCDIIGFDTYPIYGSGMPKNLCDVGEGVTELRAIAGPTKPVYAWIETSKGSKWMTYEKQLDVLPIHTRAEVWMALIRGASAIGYFTHAWRPTYTQFRPEGEMVTELHRLNTQLTRLAPAILAGPAEAKVAMTMAEKLNCHVKATQHDGSLWIFAQNLDLGPGAEKLGQFQDISPRAGKATLTVAGLKAGTTIEVVDEDRSITAEAGRLTDEFAPLREHVYKIRM